MEELLRNWGFENYLNIFKDEEITEDSLMLMTDETLKAVVPKAGPRSVLLSKNISELKSILLKHALGDVLLGLKGKNSSFEHRQLLVDILADHLITKSGGCHVRQDYEHTYKLISSMFINELSSVYFIPAHHGCITRGKLYNKVANLMSKRRLLGGKQRPALMTNEVEPYGSMWELPDDEALEIRAAMILLTFLLPEAIVATRDKGNGKVGRRTYYKSSTVESQSWFVELQKPGLDMAHHISLESQSLVSSNCGGLGPHVLVLSDSTETAVYAVVQENLIRNGVNSRNVTDYRDI